MTRSGHAYWNHNTAYHRWIGRVAARQIRRGGAGDALDVGCGDGLLLQRLAPLCSSVTGIEPHAPSLADARSRLAGAANVTLIESDFMAADFSAAGVTAAAAEDHPTGGRRFDLIVFVASLHHMQLEPALTKARDLLRPGGDLLVVGLAANTSAWDWAVSGLALPVIRIASRLHGETPDIGVPIAAPRESLREIRSAARRLLPGARIRRGLYYRYLLRWSAPARRTDV